MEKEEDCAVQAQLEELWEHGAELGAGRIVPIVAIVPMQPSWGWQSPCPSAPCPQQPRDAVFYQQAQQLPGP